MYSCLLIACKYCMPYKDRKIDIDKDEPIDKEENYCPICYKCMNINTTALDCGHQFHKHCIQKWYNFSKCND